MKKYALLFSLFFLMCLGAEAQYYQKFRVLFLDAKMDTLYSGQVVAVQNSDSASSSTHFYKGNFNPGGPAVYDSVLVPAGHAGTGISFFYYDCMGYWTLDTVFSPGNLLNVTIVSSCSNGCSGGFNVQYGINNEAYFYSYNYPGNYTSKWYFGDGQTAIAGYTTNHQYASPGTYTVSHVIANAAIGCYDSAAQTVVIADSCHADFTYFVDSTNMVFFSSTVYPATASVFWEFGDGAESTLRNPIHSYPTATNYLVKFRAFGNGCMDSVYKTVLVNTYFICDASADQSSTAPFEMMFSRKDSSAGEPEWVINNAVVGQNHSYKYVASGPGSQDIVLRIKDSLGNLKCSNVFNVYFNDCGLPHGDILVQGIITFDSVYRSDYDSLIVYLIVHDGAAGTLTLEDSVILNNQDSAFYLFALCDPADQYLVKAALLPGSSLYSSFLPTYHFSSLLWSDADSVPIYSGNVWVPIDMIAGSNPGGPGFIGGYVSQGANKSGDVLDGIQVLLLTGSGDPVAAVHTSGGGRYEFDNLALGTYQVLVEIPGKPSAVYTVTLTQSQPDSDDNDFEVNTDNISFVNSVQPIATSVGKMYPNPVQEKLYLEWTEEADEQLSLTFLSIDGKMLGRQIITRDGTTVSEVDVRFLPQGIVLLRIEGERSLSIQRLTKQ